MKEFWGEPGGRGSPRNWLRSREPLLSSLLTAISVLAALAALPATCGSASNGAPLEGILSLETGEAGTGDGLSHPGEDPSMWGYFDTGTGEQEWLAISSCEPSGSGPAAASADTEIGFGVDELGWHYEDTDGRHFEWVVAISSEPDHTADAIDDATQDGPVAEGSEISPMGPPVVESHNVFVIVHPDVVTTGNAVHFSCDDPRVVSFEVRVLDVRGRVVFSSPGQASRELQWDLRDGRGQRIPHGVYFFRVIVRTSAGTDPIVENGRLVVLGRPSPSAY